MLRKNACFFISSASRSDDPRRFSGVFLNNYGNTMVRLEQDKNYINQVLTLLMIAIDSSDKNLGYLTSSLTIESKTSSSLSPGNGDYNDWIKKL